MLIRLDKIPISPLRLIWAVFFLVLLTASWCFSADVVFIRSPGGSSTEQEQLEIASNFYGLNLKVITAGSANDDGALRTAVEREETVGVAIAADALAAVNTGALLRALYGRPGRNAPVLILGVAPGVDPILLRTWSGGSTSGCSRLERPFRPQYIFGRVDGFTGQLANLEIPLPSKDVFYLEPGDNSVAQSITSVRNDQQISPVFVKTTVHQQQVFVACATPTEKGLKDGEGVVDAFLRIAPAMMFIKYCGGEQGWHALHPYANLTIDDPWLRQPYGYVDFKGLLEKMEKHDFHTTIAFIPWNYDRSDPEVVSLFRGHPDRFSISVHGDNHDHKEFTSYRSKPLAVQIADLKQSLARMERFQALTGIEYDKVMIFPHSIAPEGTLGALKTYNYLATVNSMNVPQDAVRLAEISFALRPVTLSFGGFPSITRYTIAEPITRAFLAINEYLDNPLFFYGHSDDFANGIDAFDGVADEVNKLEPDTQWRSLGEIVKHLYLVKLRENSNYDVLAFSNSICLDNVVRRDSTFHVRKQETGPQTITSVAVDGQPLPYQLENGYLNTSLTVPAGRTRCVVIQYENDLQLASISTSKHSLFVYLLRTASDFRDICLSKSTAGLALVRFYYDHELSSRRLAESVLLLLAILMYVGYRVREFIRTKRHG